MTALTWIENEHLKVGVSALGAETQVLQDQQGQDWLWSGDPTYWAGRSPILFPVVGNCPGGKLRSGGVESEMQRHGFARSSRFALVSHRADSCTHEMTDSAETRALYPFAFSLRLTHQLSGTSLTVRAEVENRGAGDMPFGFGFHPAFCWPLPGCKGAHHVVLDNGAEPPLYRIDADGFFDDTPLPSPFVQGRLAVTAQQFEADAMIFAEGMGQGLRFGDSEGRGLHFTWENLPNFALWQKPGAPYLCLEPWQGMAAYGGASPDIMDRPGTVVLAPGACRSFAYSVTL